MLVLLLPLLLVNCHSTLAVMSPRFVVDASPEFFIDRSSPWQVGSPTRIAIFGVNRPALRVNVKVGGGHCSLKSKTMLVKCDQNEQPQDLDLTAMSQFSSKSVCQSKPNGQLSIKKVSANTLNSISDEFTIEMDAATTNNVDRIEIKIRVDCQEAALTSNSLYLWNIDGLLNYNKDQFTGTDWNRRFLDHDAISLLKSQPSAYPSNKNFHTIQLFDEHFILKYRKLPILLQSVIGFRIIFAIGASTCNRLEDTSNFIVGHSVSKTLRSPVYQINLQNGLATYSTYGLSNAVSQMQDGAGQTVLSICAAVISPDYPQYSKIVEGYNHKYTKFGSEPSPAKCTVANEGANKNLVIASGSAKVTVTCPIVCTDPNMLYHFQFGSKTIDAGIDVDWKTVESWEISRLGNQLEFPKTVPPSLGGQYSCHAGDTEFKFNVTVVSLPHFDDSSKPPSKVVAIEGSPLSFSCKAKYLNIDSVSINPVILSNQVSDDALWTPISFNRFSSHVGLTHENEIKITQTDEVGGKRLTVSVASVPGEQVMRKGNFTNRFVCRVTISETDAEKFGMQQYSVEAATDVFYLPRPKSSDFSLSVKKKDCGKSDKALCTAADGAEFSVKLNNSFLTNLHRIGVHLRMKFRIDNNLLSDLELLYESGYLNVTKDETMGAIKLNLIALPEGKIRNEFIKLKILRPIFEFHYSNATAPFAASCTNNPNCFYSTEMDKDLGLKDLQFKLDTEQVAAANLGLITGICLTVLLILLIVILLIIILKRDAGQTYLLDEKERLQGNNPEQEAKDENFKEYQRPESKQLRSSQHSLSSDISAGSHDDHELNQYGNDDIDLTKFGEDGSFIGNYTSNDRRRRQEVFNNANV